MESPPPVPPSPFPPAPPAPPQKSSSGLKWVFIGCGGCLGLIVVTAVIGAVIAFSIFGVIKSSDAYKIALKRAQDSAEVQAALGTPIKEGFMMNGEINAHTDTGSSASFHFPISGPKGGATLNAKATKPANGPWKYETLEVELDQGGKVIDLREEGDRSEK